MFDRETSTTRALLISLGLIVNVTSIVEDYLIPIRGDESNYQWTLKQIVNGFTEYTYAILGGADLVADCFDSACYNRNLELIYTFVISGIVDLSRGTALTISDMQELAMFLISVCHNEFCYCFQNYNIIMGFVYFCHKHDIRGLEKLPVIGSMEFLTYAADFLIGEECLAGIKILLKKCYHYLREDLLTWIHNRSKNHPGIHEYAIRKLDCR